VPVKGWEEFSCWYLTYSYLNHPTPVPHVISSVFLFFFLVTIQTFVHSHLNLCDQYLWNLRAKPSSFSQKKKSELKSYIIEYSLSYLYQRWSKSTDFRKYQDFHKFVRARKQKDQRITIYIMQHYILITTAMYVNKQTNRWGEWSNYKVYFIKKKNS
jgi:hypothetical protein